MQQSLFDALAPVDDVSADRIMASIFWRGRTPRPDPRVAEVVRLADRRPPAPRRL